MMDKRLLELVPEAMRYVVATVAFQWVGLLGNMALVWSIAQALAAAASACAVPATVLYLLFIGIAARVIATRFQATASFMASRDVKRTLRRRIYEKLLRLGPNYTELVPTAEVVQLSVEGCEQLETYFGQYLPQLFYSVLAPVTLFVVVAPISLPAAIVLLVCVPLIPVTIVAVQKVAKRILSKYWDQYANLGDSFLENLQGLTTLKIYQADAARHEAMNREAEHFRQVTMAVLSMQLNSIIVMDIVALGGAVAGMAVALFAAAAGAIDLFGCLFIILVSADFFLPMRQLGSYFHVAMNGMAAADKIFRLLELPDPAARPLHPTSGDHFSLQRVGFAYEKDRPVLTDVTIDIPSCGMTAIVGESGSGKSTVAALVSGARDGYTGNVLLGGKQVRDMDRAALARYVTVVGLGAHLFAGTVRENLQMAAPNATDEALWRALEVARLADFLREQDGLDTRLEQNGENLSGGQRQRLALARAILANSPVYVFDEATSNIDVESEEAIMAAVRELSRTRAVVVISHRLANAVPARCIYVMERGRVVGQGIHRELLGSCKAYRDLWAAQSTLERYANDTKGQSLRIISAAEEGEVSADE
ncbi:ABC transporter ATP-binding protein/permease [Paratractidigestivibacter sp.]|uniref:ABC transporter ATP-binding protein/permease n=1 Tax=Paratractidigestivibacter sp. TaxID=2847316 RepID=UPI002ABDAD93|nr:ABC transporter ATP-binding protein/permease [Paratractidigestivibacter sp.]